MRSKITRLALFGLLLLALAPGPLLAMCDPAAGDDCCCRKNGCSTSMRAKAQSCCNSQDSIPAPAPEVAPGAATPQIEDLPPKPEVVDGATRDAGGGGTLSHTLPLREIPPDIYTLHASLLI